MIKSAVQTASIVCIGNQWFPNAPGGAERYIYELIHHLVRRGDNVELCAADLPAIGEDSSLLLTNLASTERSLLHRLWSSRAQFGQRCLTKPDAINLHFALYSFPLLNQLPHDVPITFNFHGPWALESQQEGGTALAVYMKYLLEKSVFRRCDRFIVLSKAFGTILNQRYQVSWEKIHTIPGGVDLQRFNSTISAQEARAQLEWPQDRLILFTPRRLVNRMGLHQLLTALVEVKKQVPDLWLAIAGKGPLRDDLERQVSDLKLEHHVKFLGYLPDAHLPIAYQAANYTVVPSQSLEGFGLILAESLACGTPAICTPVGGMPDIIFPLSPSLVTASPTPADLASCLTDALLGKVPTPSREACRKYAVENYDWQAIAPKVRSVLLSND